MEEIINSWLAENDEFLAELSKKTAEKLKEIRNSSISLNKDKQKIVFKEETGCSSKNNVLKNKNSNTKPVFAVSPDEKNQYKKKKYNLNFFRNKFKLGYSSSSILKKYLYINSFQTKRTMRPSKLANRKSILKK